MYLGNEKFSGPQKSEFHQTRFSLSPISKLYLELLCGIQKNTDFGIGWASSYNSMSTIFKDLVILDKCLTFWDIVISTL